MRCFFIFRGAVIASCLVFASCDYSEVKRPDKRHGGGTPENSAPGGPVIVEPAFSRLQTQLFEPFCITCHDGSRHAGGVNLETHGSLMQARDNAGDVIVMAGAGLQSKLYMIITSGRMPPSGTKPDAAIVALLLRWIDAGADEHAPDAQTSQPSAKLRSLGDPNVGDQALFVAPDLTTPATSGDEP